MERELWIVLYKLAHECAPAHPWELVDFFRSRDRWCVPVGGAARTIDQMGL